MFGFGVKNIDPVDNANNNSNVDEDDINTTAGYEVAEDSTGSVHRWRIAAFSSMPEIVRSPTFVVRSARVPATLWYIEARKEGSSASKDFLTLCLFLDDCQLDGSTNETHVEFDFYLTSADGTQRLYGARNRETSSLKPGEYRTLPDFIRLSYLRSHRSDLLVDDVLCLEVEIRNRSDVSGEGGDGQNAGSERKSIFERLRHDAILSDVKLLTDDGLKVPAHRAVLAAICPTFHLLFIGCKCTEPMEIDVNGLNTSTIYHLLDFIYSGTTPQEPTPSSVAEMLAGADHLALSDLKAWCQLELIRMLTADNVSDILTLANRHKCHGLQKVATAFLRDHFDDVTKSESWARLTSGVDNGDAENTALNRPIKISIKFHSVEDEEDMEEDYYESDEDEQEQQPKPRSTSSTTTKRRRTTTHS